MRCLSSIPCVRPLVTALPMVTALLLAACDDTPTDAEPVVLPSADAETADGDVADGARADGEPSDAVIDATPESAIDAMPDAVVDCGRGCVELVWREGPSMTRVADHHTTAIFGDDGGASLYVFAGIETDARGSIATMSAEILRSPLDVDGQLTPFTSHGRLPFELGFHGQAIGPRFVHLAAGVRLGPGGAPGGNAAIIAVPHGPGDVLGEPVICDEALPQGVVHPTAERIGDRLYVVGGSRQAPVDGVTVAEIGPDGCPLPFAAAAPLPEPRSHHASAVVDGRIIVLGGFGAGQVARTDVLASTSGPDGIIDGWQVIGRLDPAPWTASAVVDGDWLWLIGGGEGSGFGNRFVDTVRRAPLVDGLPGPFEVIDAPLPIARSHVHQTPLFEGRLYSAGGRVLENGAMESTARTFIGELGP